jgi:2-dehydro-3-deoxygluconokinase
MTQPAAVATVPGVPEVVTLGESLVCFSPADAGLFSETHTARWSFGGAESNTAIGLARLGVSVAWVSRLGADAFGDHIAASIAAESVDVSAVGRDPHRPTALMLKERPSTHHSRVTYYRSTSAASQLGPEHLPAGLFENARLLHLTGITPALGARPSAAVDEALRLARANGLTVTFDPNHRPALWSADEARATYLRLLGNVDHLLCNEEEARLITGRDDLLDAVADLADRGPSIVIVKRGERGAYAHLPSGAVHVEPVPVQAVDSVGAGDSFNAGWIAGYLRHDVEVALATGAWTAAQVVANPGDFEGAPSLIAWRDWLAR